MKRYWNCGERHTVSEGPTTDDPEESSKKTFTEEELRKAIEKGLDKLRSEDTDRWKYDFSPNAGAVYLKKRLLEELEL